MTTTIQRLAAAPTKASTSFLLSVGLVNIPLGVLSGVEATTVKRREFVAGTDHEVGRKQYDKTTGKDVDPAQVVRMAEASNGLMVELTDDEIAQATMPKGVAEVLAFVPTAQLDQYLPEKIDQVRARTSGMNKAQVAAAERAFGLFLAGLRTKNVVALISVALRGPAKYGYITSDGDLVWLYPADGIRQPKALNVGEYTEREMDLIGKLIESFPGEAPVLIDTNAQAVQAFVDQKATGSAPTKAEPNMVEVDDLLAALQGSVK